MIYYIWSLAVHSAMLSYVLMNYTWDLVGIIPPPLTPLGFATAQRTGLCIDSLPSCMR
jgi:hypothetical protein